MAAELPGISSMLQQGKGGSMKGKGAKNRRAYQLRIGCIVRFPRSRPWPVHVLVFTKEVFL